MLHHGLITKLLRQGLKPISVSRPAMPKLGNSHDLTGSTSSQGRVLRLDSSQYPEVNDSAGPVAVLLLSQNGQALASVYDKSQVPDENSLPQTLRVDAFVGYSALVNSDEEWTAMDIDKELKMIIQHLSVNEKNSKAREMYVVLFYKNTLPDEVAKLKVDNITQALCAGFEATRG